MQTRTITQAALAVLEREGEAVGAGIMIPLVALSKELEIQREIMEKAVAEKLRAASKELDVTVGTMVELPRATLVAGQVAEYADFFNFGTNDLTQAGIGVGRDDTENGFLTQYVTSKILERSPFESIDIAGVGQLVDIGVTKGRSVKPSLKTGVCDERGGDPDSVEFFQSVGLDHASCSPYRMPIARFATAGAVLKQRED